MTTRTPTAILCRLGIHQWQWINNVSMPYVIESYTACRRCHKGVPKHYTPIPLNKYTYWKWSDMPGIPDDPRCSIPKLRKWWQVFPL